MRLLVPQDAVRVLSCAATIALNDLISIFRLEGLVTYNESKTSTVKISNPVQVRRKIGMVFQRPEPLPPNLSTTTLLSAPESTAIKAIWMS